MCETPGAFEKTRAAQNNLYLKAEEKEASPYLVPGSKGENLFPRYKGRPESDLTISRTFTPLTRSRYTVPLSND